VLNVLVSLLRMKVVAVMLGPAGVGLIGLFHNIVTTSAAAASLGVGAAGTRKIAQLAGGKQTAELDAVRRALFWGTLGLSILAGLIRLRIARSDRGAHRR
jgi:PST family polysaccharide transporter